MRLYIKKSCEEIDASFFTGDGLFSEEALNEIEFYIDRWRREIARRRDKIVLRKSLRRWIADYVTELEFLFKLKPTYSWTKNMIKEWRKQHEVE